jgi:hypothetical protein
MERARWPDERLDKEMAQIERNFDRVFAEIRDERAAFRAEMAAFRAEVKLEIAAVRGDLAAAQRHVTVILGAFAVGLLGLLGAGQF